MQRNDPNLPNLRAVAGALGELRERVVFVGGAIAGLLVTDPLAEGVRSTVDVDAVIEVHLAQFHAIEQRVASLGFERDIASGVICRWVHRDFGVAFDLMPVDPDVLGFSNRWYAYTVETSQPMELSDGLVIRLASAVAFVATKLEAFADRGNWDVVTSHDLEDVLAAVDGREELMHELAFAPPDLRDAVGKVFAKLIASPEFRNVLPGLISEPQRADIVFERLRNMAA